LKLIAILITIIILIFPISAFSDSEFPEVEDDVQIETARGKVLEVITREEDVAEFESGNIDFVTQLVKVKVLNGEYKGQDYITENVLSGNIGYDIKVKKGDQVLLIMEIDENGLSNVVISDYIRDKYLFYLIIAFILLLIIVGGIKGVKSVLSLSITTITIVKVMMPLILKGYSPVIVAILSATIITILTFIIIAGINIKSISAIVGTIGGVMFAGILAYIIGNAVKLTGLSSEEANMLMYIPQNISFDFGGLLFAGIIIGTLGAVMDVGMSISSAMYELKTVHPEISPRDLIRSGLNIGKDVMGTMSNTLILAYTGSSIPLLLLFMAYETSLIKILNLDLIATEVVRALVGSIGIIIAIPVTAFSTGIILKYIKTSQKKERETS